MSSKFHTVSFLFANTLALVCVVNPAYADSNTNEKNTSTQEAKSSQEIHSTLNKVDSSNNQNTQENLTSSQPINSTGRNPLDIDHIINTLNEQHNNASPLVKLSRQPISASSSISALSLNSTLVNTQVTHMNAADANKDDVLEHLTAVASTSLTNFKQSGNAATQATLPSKNENSTVLTAAHRSLPFGTRVKVTNQNNGKSVIVKINERLTRSASKDMILDLSQGAATKLGIINNGVGQVFIERIR